MPNQAIPPFIKYDDTLHKGQDYFFLRNEGIRLAQELAGDIWTDYNEHDPGVTILEQVCYALTDIAYRTHIDIDKLLFSEGTTSTVAFDNALFLPEQILLSPVVTFKDLRTLFIDRVHELRNIWFRSAKDSKYKGIYDVHVLPHHGRLQEDDLQAKISKLYSSHRNLCEDLGEVVIKKAEQIVVSVHLNLDQDAPIEGTLAAAYYALYTYFTPQLTYASFEALQEQGHDLSEIFDRPSFDRKKGFVDTDNLAEHDQVFAVSALYALLTKIEGVRRVSDLIIFKDGIEVVGEQIKVSEHCFAVLAPIMEQQSIVISKGQVKVDYAAIRVEALFQQRISANISTHLYPSTGLTHNPYGGFEALDSYSSIQNTFPPTYGIGKYGVSGENSPEREMQARQLQSYILFFDQILLNHLAQLCGISDLFSLNPKDKSSYRIQAPYGIPNIEQLVKESLYEELPSLQDDKYNDRKNQVLDHLLARFGERFVDAAQLNLHHVLGLPSRERLGDVLVTLKSRLLKEYPHLSQHKNRAVNYQHPVWDHKNLGHNHTNEVIPSYYTFKKKLFLFLNLPDQNLGNVSLMPDYAGATLHEGPAPEEGKQLPNEPHTLHAPSKISFVLPQSPQVMEALVHYGTMTDYYAVSTYNASIGGYGLEFIAPISAKPTILGVYETKDKAEEVKERLIHKLSLMAEKSLGFHVVEHILLRPSVETLYQLQMRVSTKVTLKSLYKDSYSNQKLLYMDAVIYGAQKQNYVVRSLVKNGMHNHVVFLQDDFQNDLLQLHILPPFKTSHEAENYIAQELIPFFQLLALEKLEIPAQVQIKANKISTTALDDKPINSEGFYNARLTLLFPAWVLRFNDPDFRTLLTHVLVKCVPAHIKTELLWLTKSQMMDFERLFKKWMELKAEVTSLPIPASPHGKVQRARQRKDHYKSLIKKRQLDVYANEIKVRFLNSQTP